jgi:hypothetical protein
LIAVALSLGNLAAGFAIAPDIAAVKLQVIAKSDQETKAYANL